MERKPTIWYQEKESFTRIRSDSFFVALISEGFAVLMIDGERVFLSAGTMIFMPRGHRLELLASRDLKAQSLSFQPDFLNVNLSWEFIEDDRYPLYCSQFDYPRLGLFYKRNILYAGILPVDANESARIAHAMEEIGSQLLSRPDHLWSCRSRSLLFGLLDLTEHLYAQFSRGNQYGQEIGEQALDYIHLHLTDPIRIEDLCERFHTNHTTLSIRFKKLTGYSITDYIIERRLDLARHILAFTELPVKETGQRCGFRDAAYFARVFRKRMGMTAMEYRTRTKEKRMLAMRRKTGMENR